MYRIQKSKYKTQYEGRAKHQALAVTEHSSSQVCPRSLIHYQVFCCSKMGILVRSMGPDWWGRMGWGWTECQVTEPSWEWSWSLLHAMHLHLCQVYCWKSKAICHRNAPLPVLRCPPLLQTRWLLTKLGNCGLWSLELSFISSGET